LEKEGEGGGGGAGGGGAGGGGAGGGGEEEEEEEGRVASTQGLGDGINDRKGRARKSLETGYKRIYIQGEKQKVRQQENSFLFNTVDPETLGTIDQEKKRRTLLLPQRASSYPPCNS